MSANIPHDVEMDIMLVRYADKRGISYNEAAADPFQEIERAFFVWSLDAERDKLNADRQAAQSQ
ncbi:hypothetical protein [Williamsia sterculiae]|uniref:Uncharacterized protein n=1 Tax=Williamsia sterculiae TaxID=1344003 RepID=A0A1N7GFH8_9NOCA|nr:hypothetical protein [Williamsia sterculiae]SIS11310.1 hypothetical protein SAMN05445060_2724 [Williamsia sterculiae]